MSVCVTAPDGSQTTQVLSQPFALVGSHAACDVHLEDAKIDARSLLVCLTQAGLAVLVLAPGAKKAGQALRINAGQAIPLREWSVSFSPVDAVGEQVDADPGGPAVPTDTALFCVTWKSPLGRQYLQLKQEHPIVIGRKAPANLVLADDRLSGMHCCVIRSGERLWAVDLGSTNGTFSGGEQHRVHTVTIDKSICVGNQRLHFTRLFADQKNSEDLIGQLHDAQQQLERSQQTHLATIDDNTMQQAALLASLRMAQEQADQQRLQLESELQKQSQLAASQQDRLIELEEQQHVADTEHARMQESLALQASAEAALLESVAGLEGQVEMLEQQRRELDARLATREMDLVLREQELDRLAEQLSEQQRETALLKEELVVERGILKNLDMHLQREAVPEVEHLADEEHCVASPDFHAILDEALGSLPRLDDT